MKRVKVVTFPKPPPAGLLVYVDEAGVEHCTQSGIALYGYVDPIECTCPRRSPCRADCDLPRRDSRK